MRNTPPRSSFSVIICSIEAIKFARISECYERLLAGYSHEIIGIHDATSLAEGYNRGIARATGEILIFSHDDILILDPNFAAKITARMADYDLLGFVGTDKLITATWFGAGNKHQQGVIAHGRPKQQCLCLDVFGVRAWPIIADIQAIDGLCMIASRQMAQHVGFDAVTFDGFHLYDIDFSYAAHLAGYRLGVCCDIPVIHESGGNFGEGHQHYAERFVLKYEEQVGHTPPEAITGKVSGRSAWFRELGPLLAAWQPDVLQRATLAEDRSHGNPPIFSSGQK